MRAKDGVTEKCTDSEVTKSCRFFLGKRTDLFAIDEDIPTSGSIHAPIKLSRVLLPLPEGPTMANDFPLSTDKLRLENT